MPSPNCVVYGCKVDPAFQITGFQKMMYHVLFYGSKNVVIQSCLKCSMIKFTKRTLFVIFILKKNVIQWRKLASISGGGEKYFIF